MTADSTISRLRRDMRAAVRLYAGNENYRRVIDRDDAAAMFFAQAMRDGLIAKERRPQPRPEWLPWATDDGEPA